MLSLYVIDPRLKHREMITTYYVPTERPKNRGCGGYRTSNLNQVSIPQQSGGKKKKFSIRRHQGLLLSLVSVAYTPGQSPEVSQARLWIMQWFGWSWSLLTCGAE